MKYRIEMKYKIETLNNKISSLNNFIDNNNFKKTLIQEKNNSMVDLGLKHKNSEFFLTKLEYFNKIHPKNINNTNFTQKMNSIYPQTFKVYHILSWIPIFFGAFFVF